MAKFMKQLRKGARRVVGKAVKAAKKRYVTKTGKGLRVKQIVQDVAMLKKLINAEKKRYVTGVNNTAVGQVNGNTSGAYCVDITPIPAQGVTAETRNGASIKWNTSYLQLQFIHQSATSSTIKGKIYIIKSDSIINSSALITGFLNPSPFISSTSIYDYNSTREQDTFKDFRVLATRNFSVSCDQISGQSVQKVVKMPLKFGHHVKFQDNTTTLAEGQVWMLIVCDNGNMNSATASSVGNISTTAVNTGLNLCWSITNYFVDN